MKTSQKISIARGVKIIKDLNFKEFPTLLKLLSKGKPVGIRTLAIESATPEEDVREALSQLSGIEYDKQGNIMGYAMTLNPTPHRFNFGENVVYGWCASDALLFPVILGESGTITSICPFTKSVITIEVTPEAILSVNPPGAVVTSVRPVQQIKDARTEICGVGLFLSSDKVASEWLTAHPDGFLHTVEEDFEIHKQMLKELGWIK